MGARVREFKKKKESISKICGGSARVKDFFFFFAESPNLK